MDSGVKPGSIGAAAPPDHVKFYRDHRAEIDPKYLTPDVLAAILRNPAGRPERIDATSCHTGSISIYLKVANVDVFRQELPRTAFAHPMAGVGDAAYWNPAGAVSAVKDPDRGCGHQRSRGDRRHEDPRRAGSEFYGARPICFMNSRLSQNRGAP